MVLRIWQQANSIRTRLSLQDRSAPSLFIRLRLVTMQWVSLSVSRLIFGVMPLVARFFSVRDTFLINREGMLLKLGSRP